MADSNQITIAEILHAVASRAHLLVDFISSTNASQLHNKRILVKNSRVFQKVIKVIITLHGQRKKSAHHGSMGSEEHASPGPKL